MGNNPPKLMSISNSLDQQQHRPQWSRNKSFPGPHPNKANAKPVQEKPPLPVSTATKNRLSNFQFGGRPSEEITTKAVISLLSDDEKENEGTRGGKVGEMLQENARNASPEQPKLSDPAMKDVPTTPAGRLALTDLIGMGDVRRAVQTISPDERIEWNHEKDMAPGSASSFGGIRKARKRVRSSSPTGSPMAQASPHFNPKLESINPQVDPGSELWGRYSLNGSNAPTPQGPSIPALAHLMHTSSPQPSREGVMPRSAAGFRRANSCGNQFPKRRRVGGSDGDDVFTESATIGPSKLAVLIERVQEGLVQPQKQPPISTASSSFHAPPDRSPLPVEDRKPVDDFVEEMETEIAVNPEPPQVRMPNSSDFGEFDDDELDETLLAVFVEGTQPHVSAHPILKLPPDPPQQALHSVQARYKPPQEKAFESFESSTFQAESDEFDDSDEDLFTANLENIASQFDTASDGKSDISSAAVRRAGASEQLKTVGKLKTESEDEFGDDGLDDSDLEFAEATATQSIQRTANSLIPVRTRFL
jgi:DNA replication ATP-dependent helicase Dna2